MWRIAWFFHKRSIDRKIALGEPITRHDAYLILKKATSIHHQMIAATWDDPALTGDDALHRTWIFWYKQLITFVYGGATIMTKRELLDLLRYDVYTHQFYIDHPSYAVGYIGNVAHHMKWKARWKAIIKLIGGI